jgi:YVTN family beta-propeller protein
MHTVMSRFRKGMHVRKGMHAYFAVAGLLATAAGTLSAQSALAAVFDHPTYSSPIVISADNKLVWSVNPGANSVSVIRTDTNTLITNITVGTEPQNVAVDPNNNYAYVANTAGSSVTVIKIINSNPANFQWAVVGQLTTGAEPWNIVSSPDGNRIFVANSSQDTITVINAKTNSIIGNVNLRNSLCNEPDLNRHFQPRGLAVTQDSTKLYVTRFLSFIQAGGVQGVDTGRAGVVCRLNINTSSTNISNYSPAAVITLEPRVTGFEFPNLNATTSAFPNQMQSIVIRGNQAYLPNIAASPSDPLRFNVDTQAFVNIIDNVNGNNQTDASLSLFFLGSTGVGPNLHLGAQVPEKGKQTLFFANPWGIAFTNQSGPGAGYVIAAGSDLLVKVYVAANGTLSFTGGPETTHFLDLNDPANPATSGANAGKNPQGIVITDNGKTAYVANFVSRNVSVVNLPADQVIKVIQTTPLPAPGSDAEEVLVGAEEFFSSRGHFNQPPGTTISVNNRLAQVGWQACSSCHFKGFTDSVVWVFNTGPRKAIPLNGTFDPQTRKLASSSQRVLNYSAIFDEVQDFDLNVRNVSGPGNLATAEPCSAPTATVTTSLFDPNHGLLLGDINAQEAPCTIVAFVKPNENRNEITVTLPGSNVAVRALSALTEWVRVAIRTPNGPLTDLQIKGGISHNDVAAGRVLFNEAGCTSCHGGYQWTSSIRNFTPPPNVNTIFCSTSTGAGSPPGCLKAAVTGNPVNTQFLASFLRDIKSFNLNVKGSGNAIPGQALIGAVEKATRTVVNGVLQAAPQDALGFDWNAQPNGIGNGFSPPSLLAIFAFPAYYHNGACETLACVLADKNHRTAGNKTDVLASATAQAQVVTFLESLDANTTPFP